MNKWFFIVFFFASCLKIGSGLEEEFEEENTPPILYLPSSLDIQDTTKPSSEVLLLHAKDQNDYVQKIFFLTDSSKHDLVFSVTDSPYKLILEDSIHLYKKDLIVLNFFAIDSRNDTSNVSALTIKVIDTE